jgi:hypothetical protein
MTLRIAPTRAPGRRTVVSCGSRRVVAQGLRAGPAAAPHESATNATSATSATAAPVPYPDLAPVTPVVAERFVDSVGVNVHLSYFDRAYNDFGAVRDRLRDLGVRNIRDGACVACDEQQRRLLELGRDGIRADLIMPRPAGPDAAAQLVDLVAGRLRPIVSSVEGTNEYDLAGLATWALPLRSWQEEIYTRVRADTRLAGVPVIGPSLVNAPSYGLLGDVSQWLDCGNVHPYSGAGLPTEKLAGALALARTTSGDKPVCVTEAGYHNATATADGHLPTSEAAASAYIPRMFLDFFSAGVPRTFLYELVDESPDPSNTDIEQHFGLLRSDFSEKPAYRTLRRLMRLVTPHAQADPAPLRYTAAGPRDLRRLVLQQDARHQVIVLWRDVAAWDRSARRDLAVAAQPVEVAFGQAIARADVQALDEPAAETHQAPRALTVGVGAQPVVLTLTS